MRRSLGAPCKPLVTVRGVPLLERNLTALLGLGARRIAVAVPAAQPGLAEYACDRGRRLAGARGVELELVVEDVPLGTIGAAARFAAEPELLVVNADNLTCLDLGALVAHHRGRGAALTVAVHRQRWRSPLGEVDVEEGRLLRYREKPERESLISSGLYVLGAAALSVLDGGRADVPALAEQLLAAGSVVAAFGHDAPWIDVNDSSTRVAAEELVARHEEAFECWCAAPDVEVAGVVLWGPRGVLLERRPADARLYPGVWDSPGGKLEPGESAAAAARREIREELALELPELQRVVTFDDLDLASGAAVRHHVFAARCEVAEPREMSGRRLRWAPLQPPWPEPLSPVVARSLAVWRPAASVA